MNWVITTFISQRGEKPVDEFLKKQSLKTQSKATHLIDLLELHGNLLGMPYSKRLDKNIFELRIRGKQEMRILYCFNKRGIILLHAFKKQTQKTPRKEIETAKKRMGS